MMSSKSNTPPNRARPTIVASVAACSEVGLEVLASLRGLAKSRVLDTAIELAVAAASPAEREAVALAVSNLPPARAERRAPRRAIPHGSPGDSQGA